MVRRRSLKPRRCWFNSNRGIKESSIFLPEPTGCSLEARHSVWGRDDVVSITTIPTDGISERDVKSRELDCSLSLRRRKGER